MPNLSKLKLKNGNILIKLPGEGTKKVGEKVLWIPRDTMLKGVVEGIVVKKCDSVEDEDFNVGCRVLASRFNTGKQVEYEGETFNLLTAGNIIAVMKENELKAKGTNVLIDVPVDEVTKSGLFIRNRAKYGEVINGKIYSSGDEVEDLEIATCDKAVFERNSATDIELGDRRVFIIDESDVIGVEAENE